MSKLLVVFGATGNQGGSLIDTVLNDASLAGQYRIRAVTRDPSSPAAQALRNKRSVQVVQADADDAASVKAALNGAHTVFVVTTTVYDDKIKEREVAQGKTIADAAVAAGVEFLILSTLWHVTKTSGGKYGKALHFDSKAEVEEYIRSLPIKTAFFAPGSFMQNYEASMRPQHAGDGSYVFANVVAPDTKMPLIDIRDTGKYVAPLLTDPDAWQRRIMAGSSGLYTMDEVAAILTKKTGKTVTYMQIPVEQFRTYLPPQMAAPIVDMMLYIQDFGYYGAETDQYVANARADAYGELTTLEEYLDKNPLRLD